MELVSSSTAAVTKPAEKQLKDEPLLRLAEELEATFLTEMLNAAGVAESRAQFGGGAGEDQFSGFLTAEYASKIAENGGIGLREAIYNSLATGTKK